MVQALWLVLVVVLAVIEATTVQLICIWFACGAVCALISSLITENIGIQIVVFVVSSLLFLIFTKEMVKRIKPKYEKTNASSLIGKRAIILEAVDEDAHTGTVKLSGVIWSVESTDGKRIEEGTRVIVEDIEGVRLKVRKED